MNDFDEIRAWWHEVGPVLSTSGHKFHHLKDKRGRLRLAVRLSYWLAHGEPFPPGQVEMVSKLPKHLLIGDVVLRDGRAWAIEEETYADNDEPRLWWIEGRRVYYPPSAPPDADTGLSIFRQRHDKPLSCIYPTLADPAIKALVTGAYDTIRLVVRSGEPRLWWGGKLITPEWVERNTANENEKKAIGNINSYFSDTTTIFLADLIVNGTR